MCGNRFVFFNEIIFYLFKEENVVLDYLIYCIGGFFFVVGKFVFFEVRFKFIVDDW